MVKEYHWRYESKSENLSEVGLDMRLERINWVIVIELTIEWDWYYWHLLALLFDKNVPNDFVKLSVT